MKLFIISFLILLSGCQDFNSNTGDDRVACIGIDTSTTNGQRLKSACDVLDTNCMSCHTGYHNKWAGFTTDQEFINNGDVIAGDTVNSLIIFRLKNRGSDMPKDRDQISEAEFNILLDWVSGI